MRLWMPKRLGVACCYCPVFLELTSCLRFAQFKKAPKLFLCKLFKETSSAAALLAKQKPLCCSYNKTSSYLVGFGVKATRVGLDRASAVKRDNLWGNMKCKRLQRGMRGRNTALFSSYVSLSCCVSSLWPSHERSFSFSVRVAFCTRCQH